MADGRRNNGGHSTKGKAGRPPKAEEIAMIEKMDATMVPDKAWQALAQKVMENDVAAIKLWLAYRYRNPKDTVNLNSSEGISLSLKDMVGFGLDD